jgi:hypothetical protein
VIPKQLQATTTRPVRFLSLSLSLSGFFCLLSDEMASSHTATNPQFEKWLTMSIVSVNFET